MKNDLTYLLIGGVVLFFLLSQKKGETPMVVKPTELTLDEIFKKWGDYYKIDPMLLKAIATNESSLDSQAIGDDGASLGLMQLQFATARAYGCQDSNDLFDAEENVRCGGGYLATLLSKYDTEGAIQAYNLGETKFNKGKTSPVYLARVQKFYKQLTGTELV